MKRLFLTSGAFLFLVSSLTLFTSARAETTQCTVINSVPFTISIPGVYCLKTVIATAMTSGNAITINANNVVIDFNNFRLGGSGAGPTSTAIGVFGLGRQNITIRNGIIRGFDTGIVLSGYVASGNVIEDNLIDGATQFGIVAEGDSVTIRRNRIVNTNSTPPSAPTLTSAFTPSSTSPSGERRSAKRLGQLSNQPVPQAAYGGIANAIWVSQFRNGRITDNFISRTISSATEAYGITIQGTNVDVARNTILDTRAYSYSAGILNSSSASEWSVVKNNMVRGVTSTTSTAIGIDNYTGIFYCLNNVVTAFDTWQTSGCHNELGTFP